MAAYPHKWSPISYRSSGAGQRKFAGQRSTLYRWTTQPTKRPLVNTITVGILDFTLITEKTGWVSIPVSPVCAVPNCIHTESRTGVESTHGLGRVGSGWVWFFTFSCVGLGRIRFLLQKLIVLCIGCDRVWNCRESCNVFLCNDAIIHIHDNVRKPCNVRNYCWSICPCPRVDGARVGLSARCLA